MKIVSPLTERSEKQSSENESDRSERVASATQTILVTDQQKAKRALNFSQTRANKINKCMLNLFVMTKFRASQFG